MTGGSEARNGAGAEPAPAAASGPVPSPPLLAGATFNLFNIAIQVGCGVVLSVLVARSLSEADFAAYLYLGWLAQVVGFLGAAAAPALAVRLVAESLGRGESGRARRILFRVTGLIALGVLGFGLLLAAADGLSGIAGAKGSWAVVVLLALGQSLATVLSLGLQGAHRFDRMFLITAPVTLLSTLAGSLAVRAGAAPQTVLAISGWGALGLAFLLGGAFRRAVPAGPDRGGPTFAEVRPYFVVVTALGFIDLVVWQKSEIFFLQRYHLPQQVALYGAAFAIAAATVRMAPTALGGVLTPAFSSLAGRGAPRREVAQLFARSAATMAALGAALALATIALAPSLLAILGPRYVAARPILPWLVFGLLAGNVSGVASAVFHGHGRADLLLRMGFVLAAVNLLLDLLLIPPFGARGAAWACACAQTLSLPIAAFLVRAFGLAFPLAALARVALATAAGAAAHLPAVAARLPGSGLGHDLLAAAVSLAAAALLYRLLGGLDDLRRKVEVTDPPLPPAGAVPAVTIVVPTKNRPDFLRRCLQQVLAQEGPQREVIVVDSSDDTRSELLLASEFPAVRRVRVRFMPNNRHFAKNQGIRLARGAVICFLDDDSFAEPGWLERLCAHYADATVGAAGGRIIDEVFGQAPAEGAVGGLDANGRLHLNFTRHTGRPVEVEHLIGCNISFRAAALALTGGFDLAYGGPNFMEETDLCLRVRALGLRVLFDPDAVVYHANAPRDAGLKRQALDPQGEFWSARSRAYFAWKLLPRTLAVLRYNFLGMLKLHLGAAVRLRSAAHLRAFFLQTEGSLLGTLDWIAAGLPRITRR